MIEALKKNRLSEFSRAEFLDFMQRIVRNDAETEKEANEWVRQFKNLVPHPAKRDLIFWPVPGADDSPDGVVAGIERHCREHGLPCFRDSAP